jgi:hypothetical protein
MQIFDDVGYPLPHSLDLAMDDFDCALYTMDAPRIWPFLHRVAVDLALKAGMI